MVGYAKWAYPFTLTAEQEAEKKAFYEEQERTNPLPEGANRELYQTFFAGLAERKARYVDESRDYCQ